MKMINGNRSLTFAKKTNNNKNKKTTNKQTTDI